MTESAEIATNNAPAELQPSGSTGLWRGIRQLGLGGVARALAPVFVGAVAGLVLDNVVLALVHGLFVRESLAWISSTSGERRRFAIVVNVTLWCFFAAMLVIAYNAGFFLNLIGLT